LQITAFTRSASRIYQEGAENGSLAQGLELIPSFHQLATEIDINKLKIMRVYAR
jgi:DNA-binding transcriptional regulator YhcF (GntR family)